MKSGLATIPPDITAAPLSTNTPQADPWQNIFRKPITDYFRGGDLPRLDDVPIEDIGMYDAEDGGIYRCLDCMHEIWDGICSGCRRLYPGHDDFDEDEALAAEELTGFLGLHADSDDDGSGEESDDLVGYARVPVPAWLGFGMDEAGSAEGSDGDEGEYEHSFIDDSEDELLVPVPRHGGRSANTMGAFVVHDSASESEQPRAPVSQREALNPHDVVELSSDDDLDSDSEDDRREVSIGARVRPIRRVLYLSEDEDEAENEEFSSLEEDSLPGPPRHLRHLFSPAVASDVLGSDDDEY